MFSSNGCEKLMSWRAANYLPRAGQANIINDSIATINEMMRANRRVQTRGIRDELNLSKGIQSSTDICNTVKYVQNGCQNTLPLIMRDNEWVSSTWSVMRRNPHFWNGSWCHHYTPESKRTSMQWRRASSPPPRKSRATRNVRKVMFSLFWLQGTTLNWFPAPRDHYHFNTIFQYFNETTESNKN